MGFITFIKRGNPNEEIFTDSFEDLSAIGESIQGLLVGDCTEVILEVSEEIFKQYQDRPVKGGAFREYLQDYEYALPKFEAAFEFKVIKRLHRISRDWMNSPEMTGFRVSSTVVYLEALSEEAEELFTLIQTSFYKENQKRAGTDF
jgi:hypothetical protein